MTATRPPLIAHASQAAGFASPSDHLREIERQRGQALLARDMDLAWALHAPDYLLVTPGGVNFSRERYLGKIASGELVYRLWTPGPMAVRFTPQMALLRYPVTLAFAGDPPGQPFDVWHLDSYELRDGLWQAVWSQATRIPAPAPQPAG